MKSRETLIRLKQFQVDERRRTVAQIETMISDFERISLDLERDIKIEQNRSGMHDPGHFAYPTYAKAAIERRDNLKRSASDLKMQLEDAKAALSEAFEEMKKAELLDGREQMRERAEENSREQGEPPASLMRASPIVLEAPVASPLFIRFWKNTVSFGILEFPYPTFEFGRGISPLPS